MSVVEADVWFNVCLIVSLGMCLGAELINFVKRPCCLLRRALVSCESVGPFSQVCLSVM